MHAGQLKASLPCAISPICSGWKRSLTSLSLPTKSTLSASDDAWRCQAPASCQSLDQQACATARSRSSRCMALSYLLLLVPKCVPWPTPVHTHRAAVGAARALLQVFRSLAAVCSPSIVAFDFRFSDRSFSATLCEKDNQSALIQRGNHLMISILVRSSVLVAWTLRERFYWTS